MLIEARRVETSIRWIISKAATAAILFVASAVSAARPDPLAPLSAPASLLSLDHGLVVVRGPSSAPEVPHIVGTVALDAGMTSYDVRWRRVSAADQSDPRIVAIAAVAMARGADPIARLRAVQAEITRRIRFRTDLDTYHVADYWAQAGETLTHGEGDSEDIAILKMQALKAAGFPARDLYLSVGRDRTRGAHAVLLVRVGDRFVMLDDRSASPVPSSAETGFEPVITLGRNSAWLHGRKRPRLHAQSRAIRAATKLPISR